MPKLCDTLKFAESWKFMNNFHCCLGYCEIQSINVQLINVQIIQYDILVLVKCTKKVMIYSQNNIRNYNLDLTFMNRGKSLKPSRAEWIRKIILSLLYFKLNYIFTDCFLFAKPLYIQNMLQIIEQRSVQKICTILILCKLAVLFAIGFWRLCINYSLSFA